jgi:hypothetical protein
MKYYTMRLWWKFCDIRKFGPFETNLLISPNFTLSEGNFLKL